VAKLSRHASGQCGQDEAPLRLPQQRQQRQQRRLQRQQEQQEQQEQEQLWQLQQQPEYELGKAVVVERDQLPVLVPAAHEKPTKLSPYHDHRRMRKRAKGSEKPAAAASGSL
jgi:hypothetical protein